MFDSHLTLGHSHNLRQGLLFVMTDYHSFEGAREGETKQLFLFFVLFVPLFPTFFVLLLLLLLSGLRQMAASLDGAACGEEQSIARLVEGAVSAEVRLKRFLALLNVARGAKLTALLVKRNKKKKRREKKKRRQDRRENDY